MKTKNILLVFVAVAALSCKKEDIKVQAEGKIAGIGELAGGPQAEFNPMLFARKIGEFMNGKTAGYGYTVMHEGKAYYVGNGGGGCSRCPIDFTNVPYGAQTRMGTTNATQFVTVLATIAALEKYGLKLDEKLYHYLPSNWKPTEAFKQLDFFRLLTGATGFWYYGNDHGMEFDDLKKTVENGLQMEEFQTGYRDPNVKINYNLAVILLPYLNAKKGFPAELMLLKSLENNPYELYKHLGSRFIEQVRTNVFKKADLLYWNITDYRVWSNYGPMVSSLGTLGYPSPDPKVHGTSAPDYRKNGGAGGLYISPYEFGQIQSAAARSKIISKEHYRIVKEELMGYSGFVNGEHGRYVWKNDVIDKKHEIMFFDFGNTQVVVFANSNTSKIANGMKLADLYDESWK
ncbi:serine hydrolase family protein [Chitinophaga niabensis]|uniref:Beta-lactamase n=1 Tax=Chitinophaga niabensis TaxID=536979 RepID=A0A1N6G254_9BACT|nr:hypothetical protein [Chitinophaga niabensis]SIO01584.1 Beta-lactamase [Chitinophaga niabensis]